MTSLLTSAVLLDEQQTALRTVEDTPVRLSYTMAMIKFVNSLLDPYQQSGFALSLHKLAETADLPSHFVELRHIGTHEYIPSLEMLRWGAKCALDWLHSHYWDPVLLIPTSTANYSELNGTVDVSLVGLRDAFDELQTDFDAAVKKFRRSKRGPLLVNFLLVRSVKGSAGERKLVKALLQQLGGTLAGDLVMALQRFASADHYLDIGRGADFDSVIVANDTDYLIPKNKSEAGAAISMAKYLVKLVPEAQLQEIVRELSLNDTSANIELLKHIMQFAQLNNQDAVGKIAKTIETMEKFHVPDMRPRKRRLGPATQLSNKRLQTGAPGQDDRQSTTADIKPFSTYAHWAPTPFGCPDI